MDRWKVIIGVILGFTLVSFILSGIVALFIDTDVIGSKDTAIIEIKGPIVIDGQSGFFSGEYTSSAYVIETIETLKKQGVSSIILDINSGGGSPVASDEIGRAIKDSGMTSVAVIRDVGASGAYWVASSTDHVIANRMSITGSIGVVGSYLNFGGLMDKYNVTYERLVSGDLKDIGSPYREMTEEERKLYQGVLDQIHEDFIAEVAENRNLSVSKVRGYANGMFFTGKQAYDMGLVDELGGFSEAKAYLWNVTGEEPNIVRVTKKRSFMETLLSSSFDPSQKIFGERGFEARI